MGELLAERGQQAALLVAGGTTLLLLGYVVRSTADVDVIGLLSTAGYAKTDALPDFLAMAV